MVERGGMAHASVPYKTILLESPAGAQCRNLGERGEGKVMGREVEGRESVPWSFDNMRTPGAREPACGSSADVALAFD